MRKRFLSFKFSGKLARLLGRESVSSPTIALFELIKNSYDADAKNVQVVFSLPSDSKEQYIEVIDDGCGMTLSEFKKKWMVVGTDDKEISPKTQNGRRKVGEKGLGRFSIERLGKVCEIIAQKNNYQDRLSIKINWNDFEKQGITFDKIKHTAVLTKSNDNWHGFRIIIRGLRDKWTKEMVEDFVDEVSILNPPKEIGQDFVINVICTEHMIHIKNADNYLFDEYRYKFNSVYDGESKIKYKIEGKSRYAGDKDESIKHSSAISIGPLSCGKLSFVLYFYPLGSGDERFYPEPLRKQISNDLNTAAGVKIYRDGFRVKPYGDAGNDWLELTYKRLHIRNIKYPDNNQIIGFVKISRDKNDLLIDTTTREGLIKNEAYKEMIKFLEKSLWAFATFRNSIEKKESSKSARTINKQKREITDLIEKSNLAREMKSKLKTVVQDLVKEAKQEIDNEKEQKDLYRNLATLGITAGYSSHEIRPLIGRMRTQLDFLKEFKGFSEGPEYTKRISNISEILEKNELFVDLLIGYIKKDKRKIKIVDLLSVANYLFNHFSFILDKFGIKYAIENKLRNNNYKMFRIDFESILTNMILNSIYFLKHKNPRERKIKLEFSENTKNIFVRFHDSGIGVPSENRDKIFEPLFTTKENNEGTGLGLTIVKELMDYYGGSVTVEEPKLEGLSLLLCFPKRD
ncbi:MAG: sensor histidine kinase [Candidatus Diapherotrites archaeon]